MELSAYTEGLRLRGAASVRDRDVVSDRCAADHAAIGTASPPMKVLVRLVLGLLGFGPGTPHP